uniref:Late embryogenesis abundant protein LEA-2 subgroup domain-containing protein n=1 Tax=Kalanchoe fedtschenkoi TaxID=63787 RepID=A0A7N0UVM0_KALFE
MEQGDRRHRGGRPAGRRSQKEVAPSPLLLPRLRPWLLSSLHSLFFDPVGSQQASEAQDHYEGFALLITSLPVYHLLPFGLLIDSKCCSQSITFEHVGIQAGSDSSGVATDMVTVNATVALNFRNTATFFGVHVTSTPLDLAYSQVTIASGSVKRFYQSRSSRRTVKVSVIGSRIPLYGSGAGLSSSTGTLTLPVSLSLRFTVRSQAYVLGKLVKPKFYKSVDCLLTFDPKKLGKPISLTSSCTYQ